MQKLEKDLYIKHANRLNVIISDGSPFIRFFDRQDFRQVLQNELDVLATCEKIFPKEKVDDKLKAKSLIKKFDSLSKTTLRLNQNFKYDDQTDLIDSINYLVTFCNNMFRVNLDDLVAGKKVTPTDPKIDLRSKPQFDDDQRINSNFAFASGIGATLGETPYQNPYLVSKAYEKLSDDMKAGTFYQYKTKPRIIPIVKWFSIIITMIISILFLVSAVFSFISGQQGIPDGIFSLIVALFGSYALWMVMKTAVGKFRNNDNAKYFFPWQFIMVAVAMFVLFSISNIVAQKDNSWDQPLKILPIIIGGLSILDIVFLVLAAIYNPKTDTEKIEAKIKGYIDSFNAESNNAPPASGVEMQKPVKVEKPDEKKDKSSSDKAKE